MKIFLTQIYCLLLFDYYSKRYHHTNENISDSDLLLVSFLIIIVKDGKKMFDVIYKYFLDIMCKYFDVTYIFKISRPK